MAFRFEDLKVWHKADDLSNEIDIISRQFPKTELFSLSSQIKKAADSVDNKSKRLNGPKTF